MIHNILYMIHMRHNVVTFKNLQILKNNSLKLKQLFFIKGQYLFDIDTKSFTSFGSFRYVTSVRYGNNILQESSEHSYVFGSTNIYNIKNKKNEINTVLANPNTTVSATAATFTTIVTSSFNTTNTSTDQEKITHNNEETVLKVGKHFREMFHDGSEKNFESHPFNRRFGHSKKSFFPIEPKNLRTLGLNRQRKKKRGRGDKCPGKGIRDKHKHRKSGRPNSRTFEGGRTPLYRRLPKWPEAWLSRQKKQFDCLNLAKLRYFIEKGRLDTRYPITQRHLHDSKCVRVKNGVKLFNVNDYPFPYKIDIEVLHADQSSIDAIKKVGGTVTIVYMERINLRAHIKPYKFEILPKTARPNLDMIHFLEKMRSKGCIVKYIKPLWLIEEEKRIISDMMEMEENAKLNQLTQLRQLRQLKKKEKRSTTTEDQYYYTQDTENEDKEKEMYTKEGQQHRQGQYIEKEIEQEDDDEYRNRLLQQYRLQYTQIQVQREGINK